MKDSVLAMDVLRRLGFVEDVRVISDSGPGLRADFGSLKLTASQHLNRHFANVVSVAGVFASRRVLAEIDFELPISVESCEQGVAWVTWSLDQGVGLRDASALGLEWMIKGRQDSHLLPWVRERAAYEARPRCYVERDWARTALKKLAEQLLPVADDSVVTFGFDGEVLTIRSGGLCAVPATGAAWPSRYSVRAGDLRSLPKRLMRDTLEVSVWESRLTVFNRVVASTVGEIGLQ